jgi:signal transduction histidine kinase/ActR/RegA family two-component response regulator
MRRSLFLLSLAASAPLAIACAVGFAAVSKAQAERDEQSLRSVMVGLATSVEVELSGSVDVLQALSASPMLDAGQFGDYQRLAERVLGARVNWYRINLFAPDGQLLITAARGAAPSRGVLVEPLSLKEIQQTLRPRWGYLATGPGGRKAVPIRVPVLRNGELRYVLTAVVAADSIAGVLERHVLPPGISAAVFDGQGQAVGATAGGGGGGAPGKPPLQATATTADDRQELHTVLGGSGWSVAVARQWPDGLLARHATLLPYSAGLALSLAMAFGLSWLMARRITRPIGELRGSAMALGSGETPAAVQTRIPELLEVSDALVLSSQRLHEAQEERRRLHEAEAAARCRLERLAGTAAALGATLDPQEMLALLAAGVVPALADGVKIVLRDDAHGLHHEHVAGSIADGMVFLGRHAIATQERRLGELHLYGDAARPPASADDHLLLQELVDCTALALRNAGLYHATREAKEQAEQGNRDKDHFLAMLGHELRNPLAAIVATLSLMGLRDAHAFVREREILGRQTAQLSRLVDDLLDASRLMRGKLVLHPAAVCMNTLVQEVCEGLAAEQRPGRIQVIVGDVPLWVSGDAARLEQVLGNLLNNAVKFSRADDLVQVTLRAQGDEAVVLEVVDQGEGVPAELLGRIFEPFVQAPQSLQRARGGLGLGLSIVKELVEGHGGTVSAESPGRGHGATFRVRLPRLAAPEPAAATAAAAGAPVPPRAVPRRVLLVDDQRDILEAMALLLESAGIEVRTAHSAAEAAAVFEAFEPQAAVLDIGLPGEDGYGLAKRLRGLAGAKPLGLIAMTGYGQSADRVAARSAGFDLHLTKPVKHEQLLAALEQLTPARAVDRGLSGGG